MMREAHLNGHRHAEAFCMMQYSAADGTTLDVWNSRDGVTPWMIVHPETRAEYRHTNPRADRYAPAHRPAPGDWVFVNLTPERALEKARALVARVAGPAPAEKVAGFDAEASARRAAASWLEQPGAPDLIRWPAAAAPTGGAP